MNFYATLEATIDKLEKATISHERKLVIQPLIDYLNNKIEAGQVPALNFICTHNSRRSQMAQVWAQTAAGWYGIKANVYSGGVEVTAFHTNAIKALKRAGFNIEIDDKEEANPSCFVRYSNTEARLRTFSKLFDHKINPQDNFAAVMTCSEADENCPFIPGADQRIPLLYDDPKAFDGTTQQDEKYDERSAQIGAELFYAFRQAKAKFS